VIELIPGVKPSSCKVYPIALKEQAEMDEFIQENLSTSRTNGVGATNSNAPLMKSNCV
jgi:hypothetical protein